MRPGRIDKTIQISKPHGNLRKRFIESWHKDIINNVDVDFIVEKTESMSFAEIELIKTNLVSTYLNTKKWDINNTLSSLGGKNFKKKRIGFNA